MEHAVVFPGPDAEAVRRFPSLDEAVRFVEHLRNVEGVADVSLFAMTPVPLVVRAYYKVEVPAEPGLMTADVPAQSVGADLEPADFFAH